MSLRLINPDSLARPIGYNNGVAGRGEILFVAGQVGWTKDEKLISTDLVEQFDRALECVLDVVREAGGEPDSIARMTVYVTDKDEYRRRRAEIGQRWKARLGRHFPAMALVQVAALLEEGAQVEIEATAIL